MEVLSVRNYRNNLAASFDKAAEGEQVLIRRKNSLYALIRVDNDDVSLSATQQHRIEELSASIRRSWQQVKQMEAGILPRKSASAFIDEL